MPEPADTVHVQPECAVFTLPLSSLQKQPGILSDKHHPLLQEAFPLHFTALQHQRCHGEVPYVRGLGAVEERYPYPLHP